MGKKNLRKSDDLSDQEELDELEAAEFQKELMALKGIQKLQKAKAKATKGKQGAPKVKAAAAKGKQKEQAGKEDQVDVEGSDNDEDAEIEDVEGTQEGDEGEEEEEEDEDEEEEEVDVEKSQTQSRNQAQEMLEKIKEMNPQKVPWIERLDLVSAKPVVIENVDDDFKRELAFYEQALEAVKNGKLKVIQAGVSFDRPDDYFAEMIKSDQHMFKVRQKLVEETQQIKRSEDAAKSRMMKKYSKQIQVQKLQDRAKAKTAALEKIKLLRKGKKNIDSAGEDFDIAVDDALAEEKPAGGKGGRDKEKGGKKGGEPQKRGKSMKRVKKDEKFGFGGRKRHSKSNTAESTDYFGKGVKKTRTGLPPKSHGKGNGGKGKVTKNRPGKSRRQNFKGKAK